MWLDGGGFFFGGSPQSDLQFSGIRAGYRMIGLNAAMLSEREITQGLVAFRSWVEGFPFPLVSTNILRRQRPPEPPVPLVKPYHILEINIRGAGNGDPETFRIGILGLSRLPKWPRYSMHMSQFEIRDPAEAAAFALEELDDRADFVIAMVDMPVDQARKIAAQVEGIDLILGSAGASTPSSKVVEGKNQIGDTRLLYCRDGGVDVGEIRFHLERTKSGEWNVNPDYNRIRLTERYPLDPEGQELVERIMAEIDLLKQEETAKAAAATD